MKDHVWVQRLGKELAGWHVWYASDDSDRRGYYAVPAPASADHAAALKLPNRIGPYRIPQNLRSAARESYGWDDYCETCVGMLARECGHRQPDREGALRRRW